jgi:small-conductance mechanosensitive channel
MWIEHGLPVHSGVGFDERSGMSTEQHDGHGNSPASWTAVIIMLVAFAIGTFAFWFNLAWLVWASAGLLVVGALVGWVLGRAGYGVGGTKLRPKVHS